ncbi:hypothetical protein Droror1_Dr00019774 [Drosera rotundifolia]
MNKFVLLDIWMPKSSPPQNFPRKVQEAERQLNMQQLKLREVYSDENKKAAQEALESYRECMSRENCYLKQLAKEVWFSSMDRNTKYFYSILKTRKVRNRILSIRNEEEVWLNDETVIAFPRVYM